MSQVRGLVEADPIVMIEIAGAIAEDETRWPPEAVTEIAIEHAPRLAEADKDRLRAAMERMLMGRDVDAALEWLRVTQILPVLFPELEATVNLTQETGRQHKDVWAHTKQVVRQTVTRPLVRWAALLHDIGKVPTRTFTDEGVHFHGHAEVGARMFDRVSQRFGFAPYDPVPRPPSPPYEPVQRAVDRQRGAPVPSRDGSAHARPARSLAR
jgi:poly(A) polymerase